MGHVNLNSLTTLDQPFLGAYSTGPWHVYSLPSEFKHVPSKIINSKGNTVYFVDSYYLLMRVSSERPLKGINLNTR